MRETRANLLIYSSHFLSSWGNNMWVFGMGLYLVRISDDTMQLTATSGLVTGLAIFFFGAYVGDWVDRTRRLTAVQVSLVLQDLLMLCCFAIVAVYLWYMDAIRAASRWLSPLLHALIVSLGVLSSLAAEARVIAVERDWVVEICGGDSQHMASLTAMLRRIDQVSVVLAPMAAGQLMTYVGLSTSAFLITGWNVLSLLIEIYLIRKIYRTVPALKARKTAKASGRRDADMDAEVEMIGKAETSLEMPASQETNLRLEAEAASPSQTLFQAEGAGKGRPRHLNGTLPKVFHGTDSAVAATVTADMNCAEFVLPEVEAGASVNSGHQDRLTTPESLSGTFCREDQPTSDLSKPLPKAMENSSSDFRAEAFRANGRESNGRTVGPSARDAISDSNVERKQSDLGQQRKMASSTSSRGLVCRNNRVGGEDSDIGNFDGTEQRKGVRVLDRLLTLYRGWRTYMGYKVSTAGLALAFLYMTVLSFHNITVAYALTQGLSESLVGILMGASAIFGIVGTFCYPVLRRRLGLARTGLVALTAQVLCLTLCVVSIWMPGSSFDPFYTGRAAREAAARAIESQCGVLRTTLNMSGVESSTELTLYNVTTAIDSADCSSLLRKRRPDSYLSVIFLIAGIVLARFGVWIADLSITQLFLENVAPAERGLVNGVQTSLNQLLDLLKYALVVILPDPETYGFLVLVSFVFIASAWCLYALYLRREGLAVCQGVCLGPGKGKGGGGDVEREITLGAGAGSGDVVGPGGKLGISAAAGCS